MILGGREGAGARTHERIVAAAHDLTCQYGWSWITMGKLADAVGVSRQTVYSEIGTKTQLAEQLIARELGFFLEAVQAGFSAHPDNLHDAVHAAVLGTLTCAEGSELLRAITATSFGGASELLPLLTTQSSMLLTMADEVVFGLVSGYDLQVSEPRLKTVVDLTVRTMLAYVTHPDGDPVEVADTFAFMIDQSLVKVV